MSSNRLSEILKSTITKKLLITFLLFIFVYLALLLWMISFYFNISAASNKQIETIENQRVIRSILKELIFASYSKKNEKPIVEKILRNFPQDFPEYDKVQALRKDVQENKNIISSLVSLQRNMTIEALPEDRVGVLGMLFETALQNLSLAQYMVVKNESITLQMERFSDTLYSIMKQLQKEEVPFSLVTETKVLLASLMHNPKSEEEKIEWLNQSFILSEQLATQELAILKDYNTKLFRKHRKIVSIFIFFGVLGAILGVYFLWQIWLPLRNVLDINKRLAKGDLSAKYNVSSSDEIGALGGIMNRLTSAILKVGTRLQESGSRIVKSTDSISNTAKYQEQTILEQESVTNQIAMTANEISETVKNLFETMEEVNQVAESTAGLAQIGRNNLQQLELLMQGLVGAANHLVSTLNELNKRTQGVTHIISTMVHIADETNMLSLNISLEASKAKQYGKGFGIIAEEIRRLAEQTASATLNIEKLIKEILEMMNSSVDSVQRIADEILYSVDGASNVQRHFTEIIDKVQYLSGKFNAVSSAVQTQLKSTRSIDTSIQELKQMAHDSTHTIRKFRTDLDVLRDVAVQMEKARIDIAELNS